MATPPKLTVARSAPGGTHQGAFSLSCSAPRNPPGGPPVDADLPRGGVEVDRDDADALLGAYRVDPLNFDLIQQVVAGLAEPRREILSASPASSIVSRRMSPPPAPGWSGPVRPVGDRGSVCASSAAPERRGAPAWSPWMLLSAAATPDGVYEIAARHAGTDELHAVRDLIAWLSAVAESAFFVRRSEPRTVDCVTGMLDGDHEFASQPHDAAANRTRRRGGSALVLQPVRPETRGDRPAVMT
jgi:hypothetical protein